MNTFRNSIKRMTENDYNALMLKLDCDIYAGISLDTFEDVCRYMDEADDENGYCWRVQGH